MRLPCRGREFSLTSTPSRRPRVRRRGAPTWRGPVRCGRAAPRVGYRGSARSASASSARASARAGFEVGDVTVRGVEAIRRLRCGIGVLQHGTPRPRRPARGPLRARRAPSCRQLVAGLARTWRPRCGWSGGGRTVLRVPARAVAEDEPGRGRELLGEPAAAVVAQVLVEGGGGRGWPRSKARAPSATPFGSCPPPSSVSWVEQRAALTGEVAERSPPAWAWSAARSSPISTRAATWSACVRAIRFTAATATVGLRSAFTSARLVGPVGGLQPRAQCINVRKAVNSLGSVAKSSSSRASRSRSGIRLVVQRRLAVAEVRVEVVTGSAQLVAESRRRSAPGTPAGTPPHRRPGCRRRRRSRSGSRVRGSGSCSPTGRMCSTMFVTHPRREQGTTRRCRAGAGRRRAARTASSPRPCSRRRACGRRSRR